jgi:hypothetical protein
MGENGAEREKVEKNRVWRHVKKRREEQRTNMMKGKGENA